MFAIVNIPLGVTTALSQGSEAACVPVVGYTAVAANAYWSKNLPKWDYGTSFLIGTALGAAASAFISRSWRAEAVPTVWRERFGALKD